MATSTLVDRYKQYKAGTSKLVNWIANTARRCQGMNEILPSLGAFKDSAKSSKRGGASKTPSAEQEITITSSQLLSLAKLVADASIAIPSDIIRTTKAVIAGRQLCAEWYASIRTPADRSTADQNSGHQHFIGVLQETLQLFETSASAKDPLQTSDQDKAAHPVVKPRSSLREDWIKKFEALCVEEPVDDPLGTTSTTCHKTTSHLVFKLEDASNDESFAIWCLLQDFRELRREIRNVWHDYKMGKTEFSVAGVVTETAVALVRHAEEQFIQEHPALSSYQHILAHMDLQVIPTDKDVYLSKKNDKSILASSHIQPTVEDMTDSFCPRALFILIIISGIFATSQETGRAPELKGVANLFGNDRLAHWLESVLFDVQRVIQRQSGTEPEYSHILSLLHFTASQPNAPICCWMVVSLQTSIDVYEIMASYCEKEIKEFQGRVSQDQSTLTAFLEFIGGNPAIPREVATQYQETKVFLQHMASDPYDSIEERATSSIDVPESGQKLSFGAYRGLPSVPGSIIHLSAFLVHEMGCRLCNCSILAVSMAHLYRAARRAGLLKYVWDDMETVIELQSRARPLVLEPVDGIASMHESFGRALGMKPSAYFRGKTPKLPSITWIQKNGRILLSDYPLLAAAQKYTSHSNGYVAGAGDPVVSAAFHSVHRLKKAADKSDRISETLRQYEATGKLTVAQLMFALKEVVLADNRDLKFNYIKFGLLCYDLFSRIYTKLLGVLPVLMGENWKDDHTQPYEVVYAILSDAAPRAGNEAALQNSALCHAAKCIEKCISEQSGTAL